MAKMLTTKEVTIINDLLAYEEQAYKKARLYSKILTDTELAKEMSTLTKRHEKRFNDLLGLL